MDQLLQEIKANNIEAIRDRIQAGDDVCEGRPIFHIVVEEGKIDLVKMMLDEEDVDVDCMDEALSQTALHVASQIDDANMVKLLPDIIELLLEHDIYYGADNNSNTPLHYAARLGNLDIIEGILKHEEVEESLNEADLEGNTPIMLAAQSGCTQGVSLLLENSDICIANDRGETAYSMAEGEVRAIIDNYIQDQIESPGQSFHDAAREGNAYFIEDYLNKGGDINAIENGETALHIAISSGQEAVIQQLCRRGANLMTRNIDAQTVFDLKDMPGSDKLIEESDMLEDLLRDDLNKGDLNSIKDLLLVRGVNPNVQDLLYSATQFPRALDEENTEEFDDFSEMYEPLVLKAIRTGNADTVAVFLEADADLSYLSDLDGTTLLHEAVIAGNAEIVQLLLNRPGVNINAQNKTGSTPLHSAVTLGNLELVKVLSNHPTVDLSLVDRVGLSAVEAAGVEGKNDIVEALFDAGADPIHFKGIMAEQILQGKDISKENDPDMSLHNAALLLAAKTGNAKVLGKLIRVEGVNINATNEKGENAVQLALGNGHIDIAKGLLGHGARVDKETADNFIQAIGGVYLKSDNSSYPSPTSTIEFQPRPASHFNKASKKKDDSKRKDSGSQKPDLGKEGPIPSIGSGR